PLEIRRMGTEGSLGEPGGHHQHGGLGTGHAGNAGLPKTRETVSKTVTALHFLPAAAIARRIRNGSLRAADALESSLERQQSLHGRLNAVVVTDLAAARKAAR